MDTIKQDPSPITEVDARSTIITKEQAKSFYVDIRFSSTDTKEESAQKKLTLIMLNTILHLYNETEHLVNLEVEIEKQDDQLTSTEMELRNLRNELEDCQSENRDLRSRIEDLNWEIRDYERRVTSLQDELDEDQNQL